MKHGSNSRGRTALITSRRNLLGLAVAASTGLLIGASARAGTTAGACADPASLPYTQKSRRRAVGYVDKAAGPARRCSLCAFFTAGEGSCGTCQMLSGGPVDAGGVCNSFAPKGGQ